MPALSSTPTPAPSPTPTPVPDHKIAVRVVSGVGEFYDRATGQRVIPRGNNYIRLSEQKKIWDQTVFTHSTFDTDTYEPLRAQQALEEMRLSGYNVVRLFLNTSGRTGLIANGEELSGPYLDNLTDFLSRANAQEISVIMALDWPPDGGAYGELINRACCELFNLHNLNYLSQEGVEANQMFFRNLIGGLLVRDARIEAIFSYQLRNEFFFNTDLPPWSLDSGLVTTASGKSYDMDSDEEKRRMADEGLVYYINTLRSTILELDPTALVSAGFIHPQQPNPARTGDPRYISTSPAIWESTLDFIDLHPYPRVDLTLADLVENYGLNGMKEKPVIMGEFGAFKHIASSAEDAASILVDWQVESCKYGFDGWLLWTWDTAEATEDFTGPELFTGTGEGGIIQQALSPVSRPDPCIN